MRCFWSEAPLQRIASEGILKCHSTHTNLSSRSPPIKRFILSEAKTEIWIKLGMFQTLILLYFLGFNLSSSDESLSVPLTALYVKNKSKIPCRPFCNYKKDREKPLTYTRTELLRRHERRGRLKRCFAFNKTIDIWNIQYRFFIPPLQHGLPHVLPVGGEGEPRGQARQH